MPAARVWRASCSFAKVDEEQAHTLLNRSGIKIELVQDVINAVCTKTNAHAA